MVVLVVAGCALAAAVSAADWQKLGSATLVFTHDQVAIDVKDDAGPCSQVKLRVAGEMVNVDKITFLFDDDSSQQADFNGVIRPGVDTDPISVADGPRTIKRVEITHNAGARGGARPAQVTAFGAS